MDDSNVSELLEKYDVYTTDALVANTYLGLLFKYCNEMRTDVIKIVTSVMLLYHKKREVQIRGLACLRKIIVQDEFQDIDLDVVKEIVDTLVIVIESHSKDDIVLENALRVLAAFIMLPGGDFDKQRCFEVAMDLFVRPRNNPVDVDYWILNVLNFLSCKVATDESITFNFPPQYRTKLLSMIRPHAESKPIDPKLLKSALTSLMILTSDNLPVCMILIKEGDVEILIKMLDTFHDEPGVVIQLLSILYNVVEEVKLFRQQLTQRPLLISKISQLLDSEHFFVSYEAAGVMAYLLMEMPTRAELLDQLHRVVKSWRVPIGLTEGLSSYRTFKPLYSLLFCTDLHPVQLYAAWCIHQTCACKPHIYCEMLDREYGLEILKKLEEDETTHSDVRNLCREIWEIHLANQL